MRIDHEVKPSQGTWISTVGRICLWALLLVASAAFAQQQPKAIDESRELARSVVTEHLRSASKTPAGGFRPAQVKDFGDIVVIEASPKTGMATPANPFDLGGKSILFKRAADASYNVQIASAGFSSGTGASIVVGPGLAKAVKLPFSFPFYHASYKTVFLHAAGNLTLGKPVAVPFGLTEKELFHVAPRIAPLDAWSLTQSVEVTVAPGADQIAFTWKIPSETNTFAVQAVLFKSGDIAFKYQALPANTIALTGITPGPSSLLPQSVDFTRDSPSAVRSAVVEHFTPSIGIDQVAIAKAFLGSHSDTFDFLALFFSIKHPGRPSFSGTGVDVIYQNSTRGIGRSQYNFARVLGTSGKLKAIATMFDFEGYPADPHQSFPRTPPELGRTPLELVSHEIAHYWLASPRILENGALTTNLLSDGCCHWSFTFDADGSFLNGNDIRDNGNGTFTTTDPLVRFSNLDQYLMGLIPSSAVGPMFYVTSAGVSPIDDARKNVTFSGTRVNVTMDQIVGAEGPRLPASAASQHSFRVAFILVVDEGRKPSQKELQKLEKLRIAWPSYFQAAASNKITMSDVLTNPAQ